MTRVAIIGGGISGIAAALELARVRPSWGVTLFESTRRLGGVLETIREGGYLVERSADNFATLIPDALQLSRECGLDDQLIRPSEENRRVFVLNRGKVQPVPLGFSLMQPTRLLSVLGSPVLSWLGKLRVLREYWVPPRLNGGDESLQSFATRRLGREAYERLVEPIVSGIFTADPATLSMQATMSQFVEMERVHGGLIRGYRASRKKDAASAARRASGARYDQFVAPRAGMSSWIASLSESLPPGVSRLGTQVDELRGEPSRAGQQWTVRCGPEALNFDAIICAAPAAVASRLLKEIQPQAASLLAHIPYASSVVAAMIVNRSDLRARTDGFGLIVPRAERRPTLAISYSSNKYAGRVPEGEILLRLFFGGALAPEVVDLPDSEIEQIALREMKEILGWQASRTNWQAIIRWPNAMPQYLLGHLQRLDELRSELQEFPSLQLCGAAYSGVGIPQCVRSGRQAAERVVEHFACGR